jgi:hypothetical protein
LAVAACLWSASSFLIKFASPASLVPVFPDAHTYLAAGERLNDGHDLYHLRPDDRPVLIAPELFTAPLISPPPIAALWRPLASFDAGLAIWVLSCWVALLGVIVYLVVRVGFPALAITILLAIPVGEQLASANMSSFFPALLVASWRFRANPLVGWPLGIIAAAKLAPVAMFGWLATAGDRRVYLAIAGAGLAFALGAVAAGADAYPEYLRVLADVRPSPHSLSGRTGIAMLSPLILIVCLGISLASARYPRQSFVAGVLGLTFGTPALYLASLVPLLAMASVLLPDGSDPMPTVAAGPGLDAGS